MGTVALVLVLVLVAHSVSASGEQRAEREYLVKAGFLFNFARFVQWPETAFDDARDDLQLCVVGDDPFGSDLDTIAGRKVRGRTLAIARKSHTDNLSGCHMVFASPSEERRLKALLAKTTQQPALTVADTNDFARMGGIINLVNHGKRIRFEVNTDAAERAGLQISSDLLRLAIIVRDGEQRGSP